MNPYGMALAAALFLAFPMAHAQEVSIILEKATYQYCEKLFYTIEVSEVTADHAIIHITDEAGKGSSAIPIPITMLQTPVPSLVPFEKEIFPTGTYSIDVQYAGQTTSAQFDLQDSGKKCIPGVVNTITANWLQGGIGDGFLIDAFAKFVDPEVISIPFDITKDNVYGIDIPDWVAMPAYWWLQGQISGDEFAGMVNYLAANGYITQGAPEI